MPLWQFFLTSQKINMFQAIDKISKFFGWIAGIIGGVSTLLAVVGFMLLKSHDHLLGLSGMFYHSVQDYLYYGGNFFISTLLWALPVSILGNIYIWIVAGIIALYFLAKQLRLFAKITLSLHIREIFQQLWMQWIAILAVIILFVFFINEILPSSNAQDLLFATNSHPEIAKRATPNALTTLKNQYLYSILYVLISAFILWSINRFKEKPSKPKEELFLVVGHFALYFLFLLQLILLPIQYGKTVYPNTFHKVSNLIFDEKLQNKIPQSQNIYLLSKHDEEIILYFADTQEVSLVKIENILNITLKKQANIFEK